MGNGWSPAGINSERELNFLQVAMTYVDQTHWSYYIGGSGHPKTQVTPFSHCISEYSTDDSGKIILFIYITTYLSDFQIYKMSYIFDKHKYLHNMN